nr:hypothetical protein [Tanacetum cinerariifolium]
DCCCSKGNVEDKILVPKLPKNYARCGHPVDGPYCQGTNVVNAPREPFVFKQDHGSFIDKIIFDLNRAPDSPHLHTISPNQLHCFHCKDVFGDGEACQRCTCTRYGSGLSKGLCYICGNIQNSLNDSPSISENSSQSPPHINHCCYECGDPLDDNIISGLPPCSAITPNEPVLSTEEPDNSLSMGDEHLDTILATELDEVIKSSVENLIPIPSEFEGIPEHKCDVPFHDNSPPLDVLKDQFEDFSESNEEFSLTDEESFSIDNIDYVEASPPDSELVCSKVMEIVIPEVGGIDDDILLTIKDDILRETLLNVNLLIAKIEALNDNLTPSSDCKTKSSSTSFNSLLEETNTFDNSLPKFETFSFDVKEISSGSPTTHSYSSLYASFIFDLSINPFPLADRSDFYEFADKLIHFISLP